MSRVVSALGRHASAVLLLVSVAGIQLFSQTQSLGDVARQQQEARKQREKNGETAKVWTNDDLTPGSAAPTSAAADAPTASGEGQGAQPKVRNNTTANSQPVTAENKDSVSARAPATSVFDRPKHSKPDVIVVPAGTELKVDLDEHKTIVPVRVGFATPIPALSQVTVQVTPSYFGVPNFSGVAPYSGADVDYVEYATVTAVTVAGKTYQVQADSLPLSRGGTNSEVTFTLGQPLKVLR